MSIFALKLVALISMILDHTAAVLTEAVEEPLLPEQAAFLMRAIGRMAFPIYGFLLAEGFRHTRNWRSYGLRLFGLGVLSQLPYAFTLNGWVAFSQMPWWRRMTDLNILFSLTLGVLLMAFLDERRFSRVIASWGAVAAFALGGIVFYRGGVLTVAAALALTAGLLLCARFAGRLRPTADQAARFVLFGVLLFWCLCRVFPMPGMGSIHLSFDYGAPALVLFAALHWAKTPRRSAVALAFWGIWHYWGDGLLWAPVLLSALCVGLYNGKKGWNDHRLFYWAYPAHLFVLWGVLALLA